MTTIHECLYELGRDRYLEKRAGVLGTAANWVGNKAANLGKGTWNLATGGRTTGGKWDPLFGVKNLGRTQQTYAPGHAMAGMRKYDSSGNAVFNEGRDWWGHLKQEAVGSRPMRSDYAASVQAGKLKKLDPATGKPGKNGHSTGEYLQRLETDPSMAGARDKLMSLNTMGRGQFIKENPMLAARYYGAKGMHHGFFTALPAYESYNILANREGPIPGQGTAANLGNSLGTGLGFVPGARLGLVGAPLVAGGVGRIAQGAGQMVDRVMGNKPFAPPPLMTTKLRPENVATTAGEAQQYLTR